MNRLIFTGIITIVIFLAILSTGFSENDNINLKIGPFLYKAIHNSKHDNDIQALQPQSEELIQVIVFIDADHLKQLQPDVLEQLKDRVEDLGGRVGDHAYNIYMAAEVKRK